MAVSFDFAPQVTDLAAQTAAFIREAVLPVDDQYRGDIDAAGNDELRVQLQAAAKDAGIFAPHAPREYGGLGLGMVDRAPVFEEAGYSLFGPLSLNIAAPDEGNLHLLTHAATTDQKARYLEPLATGAYRSAFAMTEPSPGAGSDPTMLNTTATYGGGRWHIFGRKWFITGADGAHFFIVMARTSGQPGDRGGATMFLVDHGATGLQVGRHIATMDKSMLGGHCEVLFNDVTVDDGAVLGEVDAGFSYAQIRLGPARMTHVMRWLGSARRAHDTALHHVGQRHGFGGRLGDLGMVQKLVADNEIDLAAARALLIQACWQLDQGNAASTSTSIAKTFAAEAIDRVVDRSAQMCGGLGISDDYPIARISREVRPFRIYDGPSEVHRWAIAKRAIRAAAAAQ
ncbi:acyl-CoA dehydrogenase family protein [Mycolicibacterium fortuitum]|uniref:Acyl-CoA dehydrogenase n=2 Tax=Mycolicibacterium fortuitum TaxID=1766 RepID=A0A378V0A5_MYCFO|nr:acyl-CoA dehydrogenase family protein [Mycolicibacterium fortuitum]AIY44535.1 Butyryl-CoA dehydrogenase [Mycobacterium sp. VKM Ac-1817D]CRL80738.1 acyl-CoA dehydrogenase [Mycolicibacter nonchromogenicus]EJZ11866.1 acyl-CoA dehydrogenase [Mycolicibacterium fortuitum subsp. fortuitum DSM 46621 = ATCC 6841 = JCM 6387]MCA4752772.1 acyl-CoA dehydrogenase family protein [Mycolicibacterium fortuitum]MDG5770554.1 acyl-CoA dehydrogenase family protein [Mycolicibacterium fortuitum]